VVTGYSYINNKSMSFPLWRDLIIPIERFCSIGILVKMSEDEWFKSVKGDEWFGKEEDIRETQIEESPIGRQVCGPGLLQGDGFLRDEGVPLRVAPFRMQ
jgi:hypothetical protein